MKHNTGSIDRVIRVLLGAAIITAGIYYQNYWGAIGLVPLLTGLVGRCPAYLPFGLSTCSVKPN